MTKVLITLLVLPFDFALGRGEMRGGVGGDFGTSDSYIDVSANSMPHSRFL